MPDAIVLQGITKTFGQKIAVRDLDLVVPKGGLYGFIGPNGAGKTTTIRMIMSILFPDRGELSVLGRRSALEMKDRIGYLPEERGLYKKMKIGAFLAYILRLKGKDKPDYRKHISNWLDRIGLGEVEGKKCEELSKGMQQKLQFLVAIIHEPDLLILDEPFSGLDPINQRLLRELVLERNRLGTTVIFSTHVMHQAEQICDSVVMIHNGVKVLDETMAGIRKRFDPKMILFEPLDPNADGSIIHGMDGVQAVNRTDLGFEIGLHDGVDPAAAVRAITAAVPTARIELDRPTLEDIFIRIVAREANLASDDRENIRAQLREEGRDE
jgi:ABC-2 type transport system ATP-binding protein